MCLAIPGKIVEFVDAENRIAKVGVGGVRRIVGMPAEADMRSGDDVLIHVGFATSKTDEQQPEETLRLLQEIDLYRDEVGQFALTIK